MAKGWLLFLLGIVLFATGWWFLAVPLFLYVAYLALRPRAKTVRAVLVDPAGGQGSSAGGGGGGGGGWRSSWVHTGSNSIGGGRRSPGMRYAVGATLLLLALVAVREGGALSPVVFGGLGLACVLWGPVSGILAIGGGASPVAGSCALRSRTFPLLWFSVVELKLSSQDSLRALSHFRERIVMTGGPGGASVYLVLRAVAPTLAAAEERFAEKLRGLGRPLAGKGVFLLPLDGRGAGERFGLDLKPVRLDLEEGIGPAVGAAPYDMLVIDPRGAYARAVGAYSSEPSEEDDPDAPRAPSHRLTGLVLPSSHQPFQRAPLLWEVISSARERFHFADPDSYTTFLNNVYVSRTAPLGERLVISNNNDATTGSDGWGGNTVLVEALGGSPVELSRPQLRMVVRMYG